MTDSKSATAPILARLRLLTRIDQIAVLSLERFPRFLFGTTSLRDDKIDIVLLDLDVGATSRWAGLGFGLYIVGFSHAFFAGVISSC